MDHILQGKSDPYVKIATTNGLSAESPVINDSLSPDFHFYYEADVGTGHELIYITVWDKDHYLEMDGDGAHDLIGYVMPIWTSSISSRGWSKNLRLYAIDEREEMLEPRGRIMVSCRWLYPTR